MVEYITRFSLKETNILHHICSSTHNYWTAVTNSHLVWIGHLHTIMNNVADFYQHINR